MHRWNVAQLVRLPNKTQRSWIQPPTLHRVIVSMTIRLIGNESKEVRRFELQFLEGANAGLSHSQGSDRPNPPVGSSRYTEGIVRGFG